MKINPDFVLRSIADENIIVPVGEAAAGIKGFISLNELGAFIFRALAEGRDESGIISAVCAEYDASAEEVSADCLEFIDGLKGMGIVED